MSFSKAYLIDLGEQVVLAFVATFVVTYAATNMSSAKDAAVAGLVAAATVLKGAVARFRGDPDSASLFK